MIIHVKLFASLRRYRPEVALGQSFPCEIGDASTVAQLVSDVLHLPPEEVAISLVNGVYQTRECPLNDGDQVGLWPPIAGGER